MGTSKEQRMLDSQWKEANFLVWKDRVSRNWMVLMRLLQLMAYRTSWKVLNDELGGLECTRELIYGHTFFGCWTRLLGMSQTEWLPLVMYSSWRSCRWGKFGLDVSLVRCNRMTSTGYLQRRSLSSSNPWVLVFRGTSQTLAMAIPCLYHPLAWC